MIFPTAFGEIREASDSFPLEQVMKMKRKNQVNQQGRGPFKRVLSLALLLSMLCCLLPAAALADGHVHTDSCYSTGNHLVCGMEESEGHVHTEDCLGCVRGELLCADNTGDHIHGDDCYAWSTDYVCGLEEGAGAHKHSLECYEEDRILVCTLEEDAGEADMILEETPEEPEPPAVVEEEEPEIGPGDGIVSLLQMERELSFAGESDPTADLEDEVDWWRMFADMELSGNWAEDLLLIAESQVGYTESELNYAADDPWNPKGYTRYGAWYGIPYGDWCAMFISFCLYYANIPASAMPYNCYCDEWVRDLRGLGLYRNWDEGYTPRPGDLIFFDFDMDEHAEHMGIVRGVDEQRGWIYTIEGNRYDYVEHFTLTEDDYSIIGFGVLPENPDYDPENPGVAFRNGEVEIPPEPEEPLPPSWDSILDAAAGIKAVSIVPNVEASRVTY